MDSEIYDKKIVERGKEYYSKNLVKFCVEYNKKLYGKVVGGEEYDTVLNLEDSSGFCSCPYKYNCKHAYALLESFKNKNYVNGNKIFEDLKNKDKDEILKILENLVLKYNLWEEFISKEDNLLNDAVNLLKLTQIEKKNIFTFMSFLRNRFLSNSKENELVELIPQVIHYLKDSKHLEEILFLIVEEVFRRKDMGTLKDLVTMSKKYQELWMVRDYIIEYEYYDLLGY
ncbi:MAG: hypothetical protein PWP15_564 [Methanothermococcus sp.]|jgi:hypothetical protein|uniref:SWIM zinc finger family protein n=1 Tax=Methanothermococcus TaxID=155862 RepID=UPI00036D0DD3|nr:MULTISPECIES: SWIM zinc finger family protein [Methanothermococcus]MDK2790057.1 hypothetical protein [Methanothermococcus sp.]MDK2987108.1 hypothetical protein [Methanothermococcus sp.]